MSDIKSKMDQVLKEQKEEYEKQQQVVLFAIHKKSYLFGVYDGSGIDTNLADAKVYGSMKEAQEAKFKLEKKWTYWVFKAKTENELTELVMMLLKKKFTSDLK